MSPAPSRLDTLKNLQTSNLDVAFATAFVTLVGGTFLIGFIQSVGGSDLWIQAIIAIPSFMGLFQIPGAIWGRRFPVYKAFVTPGGWIWRLGYLPLIALPLLPWPGDLKLWVLAGCIAVASAATQTVGPIYNDWIAELVPATSRGWFFSRRTAISTAVGMAVAFIGGVALDYLKKNDRANTGFSLLFAMAAVCAMVSMMFFLRMKETPRSNPVQAGLMDSLKLMVKPARDRDFQKVLAFTIVFMVGATLAGGLYVAFAFESLKLSYTAIQLTQVAHAVGTVVAANAWGYLADKYGNKPLLAILMAGVTLTPGIWLLCTPGQPVSSTVILVIGHLFNGVVWSGVAVCQMNLYIATSKTEDRANYLGMVFAVQALVGGVSPLIGGAMMSSLRGLSQPEHAYKIIFLTVMVIRIVALFVLLPVKEEGSSAIAQTLGQLGKVNPRGIRALRRLRQTGDSVARADAIRDVGLANMTLASGELLKALSDPTPTVRRQAARALARLPDPDSARALTEFVRQNRDLVEEETLEALGILGDQAAVPVITSYLNDPRSTLRRQAAKSLGWLGSPEAVEPLQIAAGDVSDPDLRRASIQALRSLGAREASPMIGRALQDPHPSVRAAAAEAVGELQLTELTEEVRKALSVYGDSYSSELVYALGAVGEPGDLGLIIEMSERAASTTMRRRCLLGAARLLGVEKEMYRLLNLEGFGRDQELVQLLRPAYRKSKRLRDAVQLFSLGREEEAVKMVCDGRLAPELGALTGHQVPELFLVAALAYARHG